MAGTSISVDKDQFCCSVCLEVLWEPVTIPCGHSYCMECIKGYWRKCELKEDYSCPQCRRTFSPRPALARNTMLADIVEKLRRTGVQDVGAKATDVECDVCTGKKHRAVKFCVKCQTLYCETHLKPHNERSHGRTHQLIEVTKQSQKRICSRHNKLRDVYCRTDQQCICSLCLKDGHKGHSVVPVVEERMEKQKHVEEAWKKSKHRCKEREKELRDIVKYIKRSAQAVEEDSEKTFTRLMRTIERKHSEVKELIRGEERTALGQTEKLLERLNLQIVEHRRGEAELEALANTEDHIHFLQSYKTLCVPPDAGGRPSIDVHPYFSLLILRKALTELKDKVNDICDREATKISELVDEEEDQSAVNTVCTDTAHRHLRQTEPRTRGDFLQYCCDLTLDPNTASTSLHHSGDQTEVKSLITQSASAAGLKSCAPRLCLDACIGRWTGKVMEEFLSVFPINQFQGPEKMQTGNWDATPNLGVWISQTLCLFRHSKFSIEIYTPTPHRAGALGFYTISLADDDFVASRADGFHPASLSGIRVRLGSTLKLCRTFSFSA